jgi:hypothetical protein
MWQERCWIEEHTSDIIHKGENAASQLVLLHTSFTQIWTDSDTPQTLSHFVERRHGEGRTPSGSNATGKAFVSQQDTSLALSRRSGTCGSLALSDCLQVHYQELSHGSLEHFLDADHRFGADLEKRNLKSVRQSLKSNSCEFIVVVIIVIN